MCIVIIQIHQDKHSESDFLDELHLVDDDHLVNYVLFDAMVNENYLKRKLIEFFEQRPSDSHYLRGGGDGDRLEGDRRRDRPGSRSFEY